MELHRILAEVPQEDSEDSEDVEDLEDAEDLGDLGDLEKAPGILVVIRKYHIDLKGRKPFQPEDGPGRATLGIHGIVDYHH